MAEITLKSAGSEFGKSTKSKLLNPSADGEPEDQLRAPIERLVADIATLCGLPANAVIMIGETRLGDLKTRPDYAVSVQQALAGFVEIKAPGKGGDPRNFSGHDAAQWEKLQPLPNLIYTDGNEWSLWRSGELRGEVVKVGGDVRTSGSALELPHGLVALFEDFFNWRPTPPRDAEQLAKTSARLCKLLRYEVTEQLEQKNDALTGLAKEWRKLLFPEATDERFADGYAQAVTFGLLMARARGINLADGLEHVAKQLRDTNSLIGTALRLLTDDAANEKTLTTSLGTLVRVLDAVNWAKVSEGKPEAWLYFYEDFLAEYDNDLRKQTGSYYTPPEVVTAMVRLVHEVLISRFELPSGLAAPSVTVADPGVGTGTFLLGVLRQIAKAVEADEGKGAVPKAIEASISRLIAFEIQLGPFAVAQLRMMGELVSLIKKVPDTPMRMYVTDTLGNPFVEMEDISTLVKAIAESRRMANEIKKTEKITVVIGNPPYKEKAKGRGGWIENGGSGQGAPLKAWIPPAEWGVGAHVKHLRNLYVYFWRWATWKVFDQKPKDSTGIVCFITVAGFINGPGFQRMRDYLRRTAGEIWIIDCSPEGHQPEVNTRLFQAVQQPVCIVMVSRAIAANGGVPATVLYRQLPAGHRTEKFAALQKLTVDDNGWTKCRTGWRDSFLPVATGAWATYPALEDLFVDNESGVMPGRTWIIAPDKESLIRRWNKLIKAPAEQKEALFHPHMRNGKVGDKHAGKIVAKALGLIPARPKPISQERGECSPPERYGFRSFDRQWIIPDARIINQPNPKIWSAHSKRQVYLLALVRTSPSGGPAITLTGLIPDLDYYNGRGGRVFPLWQDAECVESNVSPKLLQVLNKQIERELSGEEVLAYVAAVAAHPGYTQRFKPNLVQPGLRIPLTANRSLFEEALDLGREVVWLHTFGERFVDAEAGRNAGPPRLESDAAPKVPAGGAIPGDGEQMPEVITYDESTQTLHVGEGSVERVTRAMWEYEVSRKQVLKQWFSYRKKDRARPIIGDRRRPSILGDVQPAGWLAEYTTELLNVLNVIGRLIELEQKQASLLKRICDGKLLDADAVCAAVGEKTGVKKKSEAKKGPTLFAD